MLRIATFVFAVCFVSLASIGAQAGGTPCAAGSASPSGIEPCTQCDPGFYAQYSGATACEPCFTGSYAPNTGSTSCVSCDPGSYAPQTGMASCLQCAPGSAIDYAGAPSCLDCPPGYYADQAGMTTCLLCNAGSFAANGGASLCEQCPPGTYSEVLGALACSACAPGSASAQTGASSSAACTQCAAGTFAGPASAACSTCPRNAYQPSTGAAACLACGCNDGIACTRDACNAATGSCSATSVPGCQPVEVAFSGTVTVIDARLASPVTVGEPLSGRFVYDPEAPDATPLDAHLGDYPGAVTSFEVAIGATSAITASSPGGRVSIENDWISGDMLNLEADDSDGLVSSAFPAVPDSHASLYRLSLLDMGGSALGSDALPSAPPAFSAFANRWAGLEVSSPTIGNMYVESYDVIGVPEPGAALGGVAGLAALRGIVRHCTRSSRSS